MVEKTNPNLTIDKDPRSSPVGLPLCPVCGGLVCEQQCKLVCSNCHTIVENCNGD